MCINSSRTTTKHWMHTFLSEQCEVKTRQQELAYLITLLHINFPSDIILQLSRYLMRSGPWTPEIRDPSLTCIIEIPLTFCVVQEVPPELGFSSNEDLVSWLEHQFRGEHSLHRLVRMMSSQMVFFNNRLAAIAKTILHRHQHIFARSWRSS